MQDVAALLRLWRNEPQVVDTDHPAGPIVELHRRLGSQAARRLDHPPNAARRYPLLNVMPHPWPHELLREFGQGSCACPWSRCRGSKEKAAPQTATCTAAHCSEKLEDHRGARQASERSSSTRAPL
eukprot:4639509-Pyramimonas_sp.AAC.1